MNGEEVDELPGPANQAMIDAMMSPDADRAIEIFRRVVADGMRVPDPDVVAKLATQPTLMQSPGAPRPRSAERRWTSRAVPWSFALFGVVAIGASLGWSYADYSARQEEWRRIAQEQTALAERQAEHIAKDAAWKQEVLEREARLQERRQKQINRIREALDAGNVFDAAVRIANRADEILIEGEPKKEDLELFSSFVDELVKLARSQATPPAPKE
jgi:hypothetical protein